MPRERFESSGRWSPTVSRTVGRVFFVDDNARTMEELIGASCHDHPPPSHDGSGFGCEGSVPAAELEGAWALGWRIRVTPTSGPFYWEQGVRSDRANHVAKHFT